MMVLNKKQGKQLLNLARLSLSSRFGKLTDLKLDMDVGVKQSKSKDKIAKQRPSFLEEKHGIFVTLKKKGKLRGCIGFTETDLPLGVAVLRAAKAAAFNDPRFEPLCASELDDIRIEITVLTKPQEIEIKSQQDLEQIKLGEDGLIIKKGNASGLLLPQVATGRGWTKEKFLEQTCRKAGLKKNAWLSHDTKVYKFQGQVFEE